MSEPDITDDPHGWVLARIEQHLRANRDQDSGRAKSYRDNTSAGALAMEYYFKGRAEALDRALSCLDGLQQGSGLRPIQSTCAGCGHSADEHNNDNCVACGFRCAPRPS